MGGSNVTMLVAEKPNELTTGTEGFLLFSHSMGVVYFQKERVQGVVTQPARKVQLLEKKHKCKVYNKSFRSMHNCFYTLLQMPPRSSSNKYIAAIITCICLQQHQSEVMAKPISLIKTFFFNFGFPDVIVLVFLILYIRRWTMYYRKQTQSNGGASQRFRIMT